VERAVVIGVERIEQLLRAALLHCVLLDAPDRREEHAAVRGDRLEARRELGLADAAVEVRVVETETLPVDAEALMRFAVRDPAVLVVVAGLEVLRRQGAGVFAGLGLRVATRSAGLVLAGRRFTAAPATLRERE